MGQVTRNLASAILLASTVVSLLSFASYGQEVPLQLQPPANGQLLLEDRAEGGQVPIPFPGSSSPSLATMAPVYSRASAPSSASTRKVTKLPLPVATQPTLARRRACRTPPTTSPTHPNNLTALCANHL